MREAPEGWQPPDEATVRGYLTKRRNWGRWGEDDERGTVNLITPDSRLAALGAIRTGQTLSLSRALPTWVGAGNPHPAQHAMSITDHPYPQPADSDGHQEPGHFDDGDAEHYGVAVDYYGTNYHGLTTTHLDALTHVWDSDGAWNGRDPKEIATVGGMTFGGVEVFADGIVTRAVLLDVPRFRGVDFVTLEEPVQGWELEQILIDEGITLNPGDALCVYSGREKWQAANPDKPYGRYPLVVDSRKGTPIMHKPGLAASCLPFLRDHDVSALVWDMLDMTPHGYGIPFTIHASLYAYGLVLVDNAVLEPVADALAGEGRHDFMLMIAPLVVNGGTGSPVNPLALL